MAAHGQAELGPSLSEIGRRLVDDGISWDRAIRDAGCSRNTLIRRLREIGWTGEGPPSDGSPMAKAAARLKAGESLPVVAGDMGETSAVLVRKLKAVNADFIPRPKDPERYRNALADLLSEASSASAADLASRHAMPEWAVWHHLAEERRRATAPFRDALDRWQELHGLDNSAAAAELGAPSGVAFRNWRSGSAFPPSSAVERLCRDLGIDDPSRVDPRAGLAQEREGALARQAEDLRAWRERFGLSAKAARERFGCSKMTWWRWENAVVPANAGVMEKVRSELRKRTG